MIGNLQLIHKDPIVALYSWVWDRVYMVSFWLSAVLVRVELQLNGSLPCRLLV